jgi:hypothetical protein
MVEQDVTPVSAAGSRATMALTSYRPAAAPKVIADLRTSLRTCRAFTQPRDDLDYTRPQALPDPRAGDEAVAYRMTQVVSSVDSNGDPDDGPPVEVPMEFLVVRCGATIVSFYAMDLPGNDGSSDVPMDVVKAQIEKLGRLPRMLQPSGV